MATLVSLPLTRSSSFLQVRRAMPCGKARMSLNFGQFRPLATELAALERLKNRIIKLCSHYGLQFGLDLLQQ